jgi:hypothetical protein
MDSLENVWKANRYTHMEPGSRGVPTLQGIQGLVDDDEGKAEHSSRPSSYRNQNPKGRV